MYMYMSFSINLAASHNSMHVKFMNVFCFEVCIQCNYVLNNVLLRITVHYVIL